VIFPERLARRIIFGIFGGMYHEKEIFFYDFAE
jgi:hypothetical protein